MTAFLVADFRPVRRSHVAAWMRMGGISAVLSAVLSTGLACQVTELPEPNDSPAMATAISSGQEGAGTLDSGLPFGDVDFWQITVSQPATELTIYVTGRGAANSVTDARLLLLNADASEILEVNSDYSGRDPDLVEGLPRIRVRDLALGTYLVVVAGQSSLDHGDYALDVRSLAAAPVLIDACASGPSIETELEPNSDPATATLLAGLGCVQVEAAIDVIGDEDFYQFVIAPSAARVRVTVDPGNPFVDPLGDPACAILSQDGSQVLASDDDDGPGLASALEVVLEAGTYLAKVRAFGAGSGEYILNLRASSFVPGEEPTLAAVDAFGVGSSCVGSTGAPLRWAPRPNEWPLIGTTWTCDAVGFAPGGNALGTAFLGVVALANPFDLGVLGAPGCVLEFQQLVVIPLSPSQSGEAVFSLAIPDSSSEVGVEILIQALALDGPAGVLGVTTSDAIRVRLGDDA